MCTYCGWTQHVDNPDKSLSVLTSWKNPVTGLQVQRSYVLDCCHGPEEVYTEWCNISYRPFLPPSLPPSFPHHYFSLFLSPQCNLIRLDCPLATSPSGHVALYPLPTPPPSPLYRFLWSGSGLIDVQQPYITVQPSLSSWWLQSCHTARSIRVTPRCAYWSLSQKPKNTFANYRTTPASSGTVKIMLAIIHM